MEDKYYQGYLQNIEISVFYPRLRIHNFAWGVGSKRAGICMLNKLAQGLWCTLKFVNHWLGRKCVLL